MVIFSAHGRIPLKKRPPKRDIQALENGDEHPHLPYVIRSRKGGGSQLTASTGYPLKNQRILQHNKTKSIPKKSVDFSGQIRTAYHHFPYESLWYHPAAKNIPTVFFVWNVQEGRRNHRCRSQRWRPISGVGCVMIMVAPGCTGCHKPQEAVCF